jgi:hypothetical protein
MRGSVDDNQSMTASPDAAPHRVYSVTFRALDGSVRVRRVITNRGDLKAVFIATRAESGLFRGFDALDISVSDDGPPELGPDGAALINGLGADRNEW